MLTLIVPRNVFRKLYMYMNLYPGIDMWQESTLHLCCRCCKMQFKKIQVVIRELNLISIPKSIKYLMTCLKTKSRLRFTWNLSVDNCKEEWKINITSYRKKTHNPEKYIISSLLYTSNLPRYLQLRIELETVTVGLLLDAVNWLTRYI